MPFLAPAIPALIGAGASFGLGKLGGKGGLPGGSASVGPTSPTFRRAEQLGDLAKNYGFDYALPEGKKLTSEAEAGFQPVLDYYKKLLTGNRAEMMSTLAPEIGAITDEYNQAKKNIGTFTPRGGGQTALLSELPFKQMGDIQKLIQTVRPQAAQGLSQTAGQVGGLAGQVTGEGLQAGQLSLNAIADQINALLGKSAQDIPLQQDMGSGLYQILSRLPIFQGGGGGGGGGFIPPGYDPNAPGE